MILSFGLKFEINYIRNNLLKISIIFGILSIFIAIIGIIIDLTTSILFIVVLLSNFLLLVCWHYSPSIYKKEKVWAVISGVSYAILTIIFILNILFHLFGILTGLIPIILLFLGFFLIFLMELIMKRKGLLNYV
jgi:amino acid transporter